MTSTQAGSRKSTVGTEKKNRTHLTSLTSELFPIVVPLELKRQSPVTLFHRDAGRPAAPWATIGSVTLNCHNHRIVAAQAHA